MGAREPGSTNDEEKLTAREMAMVGVHQECPPQAIGGFGTKRWSRSEVKRLTSLRLERVRSVRNRHSVLKAASFGSLLDSNLIPNVP